MKNREKEFSNVFVFKLSHLSRYVMIYRQFSYCYPIFDIKIGEFPMKFYIVQT